MRNEICILIGLSTDENIVKKVEQKVFCGRKSASRSEYYNAYAVGLKPKFILEIDPFDRETVAEQLSDGDVPSLIRYRGAEYNILRNYQTDESTLELTVG